MGGAEEMPAGTDLADGLEAERVVVDGQGGEKLHHHLHQVAVEDEFLEGGDQAAFQPAGPMHDEIAAAHGDAPQREHDFIGRLGIDGVGGAGVGGAVGQAVAARQLAADDARLHVFGRAEGRRARFHVDVGGEAAIDDGRALAHELGQGEAGQRLGVLLDQRAGDSHRRHGAGQREGRDADDLIARRHLDDALQHRRVELQRASWC